MILLNNHTEPTACNNASNGAIMENFDHQLLKPLDILVLGPCFCYGSTYVTAR